MCGTQSLTSLCLESDLVFRRAPEPVAIATILAVSLAPLVFRSCLSALFNRAASVSLTCLKVMIVAGDIDFFLRENQTIALRLLSDSLRI